MDSDLRLAMEEAMTGMVSLSFLVCVMAKFTRRNMAIFSAEKVPMLRTSCEEYSSLNGCFIANVEDV